METKKYIVPGAVKKQYKYTVPGAVKKQYKYTVPGAVKKQYKIYVVWNSKNSPCVGRYKSLE